MCLTEIVVPCAWPARGPAARTSAWQDHRNWPITADAELTVSEAAESIRLQAASFMDSLRHSSQAPNNPHDGSEPHISDMTKQTTTDTGESRGRAGTRAISVWGLITQGFRQLRTLCCYIYLSEKSWGVTRCCQTDINVVYKGQQLN